MNLVFFFFFSYQLATLSSKRGVVWHSEGINEFLDTQFSFLPVNITYLADLRVGRFYLNQELFRTFTKALILIVYLMSDRIHAFIEKQVHGPVLCYRFVSTELVETLSGISIEL